MGTREKTGRLSTAGTAGVLFFLCVAGLARPALAESPASLPSFASPPVADADSPAPDLALRRSDPPAPEANHRGTLALGGLYLTASLSALVLFPPDNWHGNIVPDPGQFARSWTQAPTWHDGDPWTTNYVGHPIMGSVLYLFARRNSHSPLQAFLFSTLASTTWEYAFESWYEQPSWSDLLVTSTGGALIGEGRWWIRQRLLRNGTPGALGQVALFLVDPITEIDLLFGF